MRILIQNGQVIDPLQELDTLADVFIADGRIAAIGTKPDGFVAEQTIDARQQIVCPGFVDLCARLREPGNEHKASIASETRAAAAGGVTTLCVPPDTQPVIDTPAVIELIHQRAEQIRACRVLPIGALTRGLAGEHLSEMARLKSAGCVAVSNAQQPFNNTNVMRRALEYAANNNLTVFVHADDSGLSKHGCVHEGVVSTRLGLPGLPEAAETLAVSAYLMLIEQTGARVHFCRLSTARAIQMINRAKYDGHAISSDVAAHQLHLTELDIGFFDSNCHLRPPLRSQRDRDGLRDAVSKGRIEAICSDHQPHDVDAKLAPFCQTEPGISALETLLPLSLRLVEDHLLSMKDLLRRLSSAPARILGIDAGHLRVGARADICIFDPERLWTLTDKTLHSRGHNTPFLNWELKGRVTTTLLDGQPVFELPP
ncbi:MAG: dihydroorotase [Gammaproteobacteria bacterium]|nr:dihydroorotase [Gammaproteobacteria bacterium]